MTEYKTLFSLGAIYPSDFLKPGEEPRCAPVELKLVMDENGTVCLEKSAPDNVMWGERYWYRSSLNTTMQRQLKDIVDSALEVFKVNQGEVFLDIASNDGFLLSCVPDTMRKIGVDPVGGSIRDEAEKRADYIIQDYFSAEVYKKSLYGQRPVKVCSCISMFYDLEEPGKFLDDVYEILDDDGLFILQLSYTPLMIYQLEFSNICHEHKKYFCLTDLKKLLEKHKFKIMDVQLNNTNSGSFRLHVMKKNGADNYTNYATRTHRDVCDFRIISLLELEKYMKVNELETWLNFASGIRGNRQCARSWIISEKNDGKVIYAYGASTKGNTILQAYGLDNSLITAIADKNTYKHGLRTVGTNIPIISEEQMRLDFPDYLVILPSHFLQEFMEREKEYLNKGGVMIICCPFQVIRK